MTTQELIDRFNNLLSYDFDSIFGVAPTNAQVISMLNDAISGLSQFCPIYQPLLPVTLTGYAGKVNIDLNTATTGREMVRTISARFGTVGSLGANGKKGFYTINHMEDLLGMGWISTAQGTPRVIGIYTDRLLAVSPPPSAAWIAANVFTIEAWVEARALNDATLGAQCEFPNVLHPRVPEYALALTADGRATEPQQLQRLMLLKAKALDAFNAEGARQKGRYADRGPSPKVFGSDWSVG